MDMYRIRFSWERNDNHLVLADSKEDARCRCAESLKKFGYTDIDMTDTIIEEVPNFGLKDFEEFKIECHEKLLQIYGMYIDMKAYTKKVPKSFEDFSWTMFEVDVEDYEIMKEIEAEENGYNQSE